MNSNSRSRIIGPQLKGQQQEPSPDHPKFGPPPAPLCIHCGKTLHVFHGRFARCSGGETQFTPGDVA